MTKQEFRDRVKGLFSVRWIKNAGTEGYIHRGILGLSKHIDGEHKEHNDYVLAFRVGSGLLPEHARWVNINPNTVLEVNRVAV